MPVMLKIDTMKQFGNLSLILIYQAIIYIYIYIYPYANAVS